MDKTHKADLIRQVLLGAREYGIAEVLFRHTAGEILGISLTDFECLSLIFFKGLATPTELSEYTGLTSGATTAMLDRLEKARLVERSPNPKDRRGTLVTVRQEAAGEVGPLFQSARLAQEAIASSYSEQELDLLAGFFERSITMWGEERQKLLRRQETKSGSENETRIKKHS